MTKPSDFSPAEALEVRNSADARRSRRTIWLLRVLGAGILLFGWLAVSLHEFGRAMFIVDTVVFLAMALYAFTAAAVSRRDAVVEERKLRLRLLVHNMELENMAMRDELTQLFNRRYLFERLEREFETAKGFQRPLAFIAIHVKSIGHFNDTYGYAGGDQLLAAFGQLLMDCTRATDIPARMGGSKFGIILPDTSKRGAYTMIERLVQSLAATPLMDDSRLDTAVVAFGVSGYPWGSDTMDGVVRQAEAEMAVHSSASDAGGDGSVFDEGPTEGVPAVFRKADDVPETSQPVGDAETKSHPLSG
jgi:diguanylate cyclase (GGDEF)-like protein